MCESHTRVNVGIDNNLVVRFLLETTCTDIFIKTLHPDEKKIFSQNSPLGTHDNSKLDSW